MLDGNSKEAGRALTGSMVICEVRHMNKDREMFDRTVGASYKRKGQKLGRYRECWKLSATKWLSDRCTSKNSHQDLIRYS